MMYEINKKLSEQIPFEFDLQPKRLGFTMRGWDFTRADIADAIVNHKMLNPAMELGSNICPWNCSFCFTESPHNPKEAKRRLSNEMTLQERLTLIDQAAELGARSINIVGAGEPTIDPHFWKLLERIADHGICPIVYTEGALRLTRRPFVKQLYKMGATVVLKVNSLWNVDYQNAVVKGLGTKPNVTAQSYTTRRNRALEILIEEGFTDCEPTRLAFDTIICQQNKEEIIDLHFYARTHNIFVLMVNYLPSGRSSDGLIDSLTLQEQMAIFDQLAIIDKEQFGINHKSHFPYAGGVPCSIRGTGLFIKINGSVFDCPGEMIALGNFRKESLEDIWKRSRPIVINFDGCCAPRENYWKDKTDNKIADKFEKIVQIERMHARSSHY